MADTIDEILDNFANHIGDYANFGSPFNSNEDNIAGAEALYQVAFNETKAKLKSLLLRERQAELEKFIQDANTFGLPNGDFEIAMRQRIQELSRLSKGEAQ